MNLPHKRDVFQKDYYLQLKLQNSNYNNICKYASILCVFYLIYYNL